MGNQRITAGGILMINRKICPAGLKNNPNKNLTSISFITIHCTGNYNTSANARNHADYIFLHFQRGTVFARKHRGYRASCTREIEECAGSIAREIKK
jgi:hypothetical protein